MVGCSIQQDEDDDSEGELAGSQTHRDSNDCEIKRIVGVCRAVDEGATQNVRMSMWSLESSSLAAMSQFRPEDARQLTE